MTTMVTPWTWSRGRALAIGALVIAAILLPVAAFLSSCATCGEFHGGAVVARALVEFAPVWLLGLAALAWRFRTGLVVLMVAAAVMTILTVALGTSARSALEPLGLDSAPGFLIYAVPFAVTTWAAWLGLRS